jgi:hypothetical protein
MNRKIHTQAGERRKPDAVYTTGSEDKSTVQVTREKTIKRGEKSGVVSNSPPLTLNLHETLRKGFIHKQGRRKPGAVSTTDSED